MKTRSLMTTMLLMGGCVLANAIDMPETTFEYNVQYQWGFIDVAIGNAVAHVSINNDSLSGTLAGHSIPWEGRVFSVGDTIQANMTPTTQTNSYINGWYRKPKVDETVDTNNPAHYRTIQGQGTLNTSSSTIEAITITAQMIGLFYYAQVLDFDSMTPGDKTTINITSQGLSPETLVITYNGIKQEHGTPTDQVYDITFEYSYNGEMSNYPVECKIRTTDRVPVYFAADLKIGHVDMYLN